MLVACLCPITRSCGHTSRAMGCPSHAGRLAVSLALHIQLMGGFRLVSDAAPLTTLDVPRLQALLAYLVLHRTTPHARPHLAFRLWPDTTEAQARTNLRTLLHRLRQALPDSDQFLHIDAQTVQ